MGGNKIRRARKLQTQRFEADSLADDAVSGEPVSGSEFPVIREKNKEFRGIARLGPKIGANLKANSECYREIPCAAEQGIFLLEQGMLRRHQGIGFAQYQMHCEWWVDDRKGSSGWYEMSHPGPLRKSGESRYPNHQAASAMSFPNL
jgi:hypothetical protein